MPTLAHSHHVREQCPQARDVVSRRVGPLNTQMMYGVGARRQRGRVVDNVQRCSCMHECLKVGQDFIVVRRVDHVEEHRGEVASNVVLSHGLLALLFLGQLGEQRRSI